MFNCPTGCVLAVGGLGPVQPLLLYCERSDLMLVKSSFQF